MYENVNTTLLFMKAFTVYLISVLDISQKHQSICIHKIIFHIQACEI